MQKITKLSGCDIQASDRKNYNLIYPVSCTTPPRDYHTGSKLDHTIQLINSFKTVTIILADKLQRHTTMIHKLYNKKLLDKPIPTELLDAIENQAHKEAIDAGKQWKINNSEKLNRIQVPVRYLHWNEILNTQEFKKMEVLIQQFTLCQPLYQQALTYSSDKYLRNNFELNIESYKRAKLYSDAYVNEETAAVLSWSLPHHIYFNGNIALLYPTKLNAAMYTADGLAGAPKLLSNMHIRFARSIVATPS